MGGCGRAIRGRSLPMVGGRLIVSLTRSRLAVALRGRGLARRGGGLPDLGLHSGGLEWGRRGGRLPLGSEEYTSELQSRGQPVCRLLLEKKNRARKILVND